MNASHDSVQALGMMTEPQSKLTDSTTDQTTTASLAVHAHQGIIKCIDVGMVVSQIKSPKINIEYQF